VAIGGAAGTLPPFPPQLASAMQTTAVLPINKAILAFMV
jgi:hypothetical protein